MQENDKNAKPESKYKQVYNPIEKRLHITENKIADMMEKIKQEINALDVEYMQLKAMTNITIENDSFAKEENSVNFDDINEINALECNFDTPTTDNVVNQLFSDSESDDVDLEEDETIDIFR